MGWDNAGHYDSYEHSWPCSGRLLMKYALRVQQNLDICLCTFLSKDFFLNQDLHDYSQLIIWKAFSSGLQAIKLNTINVGLAGLHAKKSCSVFAQNWKIKFCNSLMYEICWCSFSLFSQLFLFAAKLLMQFSYDKWSPKSHTFLPLVQDLVGTRDWERMNCYSLQ